MQTQSRYFASELIRVAESLLAHAGLSPHRAHVMAATFLEADLLGYSTHGLKRLAVNLEWLRTGETRKDGEPVVLHDAGSTIAWDAHFLPGPWVMNQAIDELLLRSRTHPCATLVLQRAQHIACLAAYLRKATDAGRIILITASTPSEPVMAPFGGIDRVFSTGPLAAGIPTSGDPILIDFSTTVVSLGEVAAARKAARPLKARAILRDDGTTTDEPLDALPGATATLLPIGGQEHGHKGFGLALLVEALSAGLASSAKAPAAGEGEANAVFIQLLDPERFNGSEAFLRHMDEIVERCRSSRATPGGPPVRLPGERALQLRRQQLGEGVQLAISVATELTSLAHQAGISPAQIIRE